LQQPPLRATFNDRETAETPLFFNQQSVHNSLSNELAQTFRGKVANLQFSGISLDRFFNQWEIVAKGKRLNFLLP
jgi:hypothetical protein